MTYSPDKPDWSSDGWGQGPQAHPPRSSSRNGVVWAMGALIVVLLVALAGIVGYLLAADGDGPSAGPAPTVPTAPALRTAVSAEPGEDLPGTGARTALSAGCDPDEISIEAGIDRRNVTVDRCLGGWALAHGYVPVGEPAGDTQYIVSRNGGSWSRYTGIPSSTCRQEAVGDGMPAELAALLGDCSATAQATSAGDLGLGIPMSRPKCDGRGIVVLYSAVTPGEYSREISAALAQNPGASYLRTDMACPSLRPRDENGNVIYAVYRPSGYSRQDLCAAVRAEGAPAYGRWLDTSSDTTQLVTC